MLNASWNFKRVIAGVLSTVALLTVAGGLISCEAGEREEVEETEEQREEGYNQPLDTENEEREGEEDD